MACGVVSQCFCLYKSRSCCAYLKAIACCAYYHTYIHTYINKLLTHLNDSESTGPFAGQPKQSPMILISSPNKDNTQMYMSETVLEHLQTTHLQQLVPVSGFPAVCGDLGCLHNSIQAPSRIQSQYIIRVLRVPRPRVHVVVERGTLGQPRRDAQHGDLAWRKHRAAQLVEQLQIVCAQQARSTRCGERALATRQHYA